ncbi:hypothetical protein [Mangrovimicrobium sediminis]|uniref:hypothetical protein n=1 Tax=Mangrovimicrobium sediminis TaxID=2562682 RepID=UPI001436AF7B|nr:hypothetical protein [Haliea sp. SAOS-164]
MRSSFRLPSQPDPLILRAYAREILFPDEPAAAPSSPTLQVETAYPPIALRRRSSPPPAFTHSSSPQLLAGRRVWFAAARPFADSSGQQRWQMYVDESLVLCWSGDATDIEYWPGADFSVDSLRFWVLHTLVPICLALNGEAEVLHAGAVLRGGQVLGFCGASRAGKSTLTDYCLQRGDALVADDALALVLHAAAGEHAREIPGADAGRSGAPVLALPAHPFHRPYRQVEDLGVLAENPAAAPAPLRALVHLVPVAAQQPARLAPVSGVAAWRIVHDSVFSALHYMRPRQFSGVAQLADRVPVYQLELPHDLARLDEVYELLGGV